MSEADWLLIGGAGLFAVSTALILVALSGGPATMIPLGLLGLVGAALCLAIGARRLRTRVDGRRMESEQRLWASGPLGRAWLRIRQTLHHR